MIRKTLLGLLFATSCHAAKPPAWFGYAGDAQHEAAAPALGDALSGVRWQTPVDLVPQYNQNELLIHYGSPMITGTNLVLLPVKTTATGDFRLEAHRASDGATQWMLSSDYVLPPSDWTPSFPAQITSNGRAYIAAAGGTVLMRDRLGNASAQAKRLAFYGVKIFNANVKKMTEAVMVDTPITSDAAGNIYFGFLADEANPAKLVSGIARIGADGAGRWVGASAAAGDAAINEVAMDSAPAISADGSTVYVAVSNGSAGYLLGLDAATLATKYKVAPADPASGQPAWIADISSASPTIGPDGDVYYGVLENPYPNHNNRGWLMHYDATLTQVKIPGSFGWDDTVSVVPSALVPKYKASGSYLLMTKYNNYLGIGHGDGQNEIAILDPGASQKDEYSPTRVTVMKEALTQLSPTQNPQGGLYEWCVNSAVVDAFGGAVFASSEDGVFYRWDLARNKLSESLTLNAPQPEAYTPSLVGPDGTVYAINKATLYAIGK